MIKEDPRSFVRIILFSLGYSLTEIKELYPMLIDVTDQKYKLIPSELIDQMLNEE